MIQVIEYEEQEDGSAIMELSLSEEAIQLLIQEGLTSVLKRKLDETRSLHEGEVSSETDSKRKD